MANRSYLVSSDVKSMDIMACANGIPKLLKDAGVGNVSVKTCYCCGPEGKMVVEFTAPDRETLSKALEKIEFPVSSIMETKKVEPK